VTSLILALFALTGTFETFSNADLVLDVDRKADTLFLATSGGLLAYVQESDTVVKRYTNVDGLNAIILQAVCVDPQGGIWVSMKDWGIAFRRPNGAEFETYPTLYLPSSARNTRDLLSVGDTLLLATEGGIVILDTRGTYDTDDDGRRSLSILYPKLGSNLVLSLDLHDDTLYVGTGKANDTYRGGVTWIPFGDFDSDSTWTYWSTDSLPGDSVLSVRRTGATLAAGTNNGLFLFGTGDTLLGGSRIRSLSRRADTLFAGTDASLHRIDPSGSEDLSPPVTDVRSTFVTDDGDLFAGFGVGRPENDYELGGGLGWYANEAWTLRDFGQLRSNRINGVVATNDGTVWFSSFSKTRRESYLFGLSDTGWFAVDSSVIMWPWWLERSPDGSALWVGTWPWTGDSTLRTRKGGLFKLNSDGEVEVHYSWPDILPTPLISCIAFDPEGNPVVGCGQIASLFGWFRINPDSSVDELYALQEAQVPNQVAVDPEGRIWTGGEIEAIQVVDPEGSVQFSLSTSNGLPSDVIWRLVPDGETMWIGTSEGLASHRDGLLTVYDHTGLNGEIKDIEPAPDGRLWVLTDSSLVLFHPENDRVDEIIEPAVDGLVSDFGIPDWLNPYVAFRVKNALEILPSHGRVWIGTGHGVSLLETDFLLRFSEGHGVRVYPNPYKEGGEAMTITFANLETGATLRIFTLSGELVPENRISLSYRTNSASIDPSELSPGTYLGLVETPEGESEVVKFAVIK
jgi:hypothetical protein